MVEFDEFKIKLNEFNEEITLIGDSLHLPQIDGEAEELEKLTVEPGFWDDNANSQKILQKIKQLKDKKESYHNLFLKIEDAQVLNELAMEEQDNSLVPEVQAQIEEIETALERLKLTTLLNGQYDANNAILTLHAGAGGTEAQDWTEMLYRMYTMWCQKNGYTITVLDYLEGGDAGIKSVTFKVEGVYAYGYLKGEKGVHRLVRISPFDSSARRHTSFCSLDVFPEIEEDGSVEINPDDLRIDTYRASGAGGQHVNKTSSAVRITHIPTGIVVQCQNERSQLQNKDNAMKMLKSKLIEVKERESMEKMSEIKGDLKKIEWGSQIRSYVFHPYTMAKDHRTNAEVGNINAVMDGDIDVFIQEYLKKL